MSPSGSPGRRPPRVRVTSPRMGTTTRVPTRSPAREISEQTGLGEVYVRSLLRAQLRAVAVVLGVLVLVLGTLPLVFAGRPELSTVRFAGLPLAWWVIGCALYPAMWFGAWWLERTATRLERDFAEIVSRS